MSAEQDDRWPALVSYTTSDRAGYVKRYLPHLARACMADARVDLLVALDGPDPETRAFCEQWDVALLFSDMNRGQIHHMSLFSEAEGSERTGETTVLGERIVHFNYGSAEFNAFTREGLQKVGNL